MATVLFNREISSGYYKMRILCPIIATRAKPGQFVMVRVAQLCDPLLRRPFGIHNVCGEKDNQSSVKHTSCIEILYQVVGRGTHLLSGLTRNAQLDLIGPLGKGFSLTHTFSVALMVAGGIGIAPFLLLARTLKKIKGGRTKLIIFIGGATKGDILCRREFEKMGAQVEISTEDGSTGRRGVITEHLLTFLEDLSCPIPRRLQLFGCGPMPMLQTLSEIALSRSIPCQISLESKMACGVGACLGCCVATCRHTRGEKELIYQRVCKEGPVFDSTIVKWDNLNLGL